MYWSKITWQRRVFWVAAFDTISYLMKINTEKEGHFLKMNYKTLTFLFAVFFFKKKRVTNVFSEWRWPLRLESQKDMSSSLLDCCNCDSYIPSKVSPFSNPAWFIYKARVCLSPCLKISITIFKRQRELAFCPLIRQIPIVNTGIYSFIVPNY